MKQQTSETSKSARSSTGIPSFPVRLVDVRLRKVHAELAEIEEGDEEFVFKIFVSTEEQPDQERFFAILELDAQRRVDEEEMVILTVAVEGAFESVEGSGETDEKAGQEFAEKDTIVLLWPYLREQVHSLTGRMRLRVPPLPVVDVRTLIEGGESDGSESVSD